MASSRQTLSVRKSACRQSIPATNHSRTLPPQRHSGMVRTPRISGETPNRLTPPLGTRRCYCAVMKKRV
jgi:hypothetical protein